MMSEPKDCSSRREFLQLTCFTMTAAAFGLNGADAAALPISFESGAPAGQEQRYAMPTSDGVTIDRKQQVIADPVGWAAATIST
jgi:hypothetical protein